MYDPLTSAAHVALVAASFTLAPLSALAPPPVFLAFDVAIEPVSRATNLSPLLLFLPIVFVETIVLRLMRWGTLARAALGAFVMNAVSTLVGAVLTLSLPFGLVVALLLSFLIEGVVLMLFNRQHKRRSWLSALAANLVSYALLFLLLLVTR